MKQVFERISANHLELKNRLVRSATWEGIANPDGSVTEEAYEIYGELAKGGVGAIITGFTSVALHDYYFGGMMRLCDDALIPQYRKLTVTALPIFFVLGSIGFIAELMMDCGPTESATLPVGSLLSSCTFSLSNTCKNTPILYRW